MIRNQVTSIVSHKIEILLEYIFINTLDGDNDIENTNLRDNNTENLYAKLAPFIKTHIFEKLTVNHLPYYSSYLES